MSKDFDIGFRVFCCLGFKKEFWFLFFSLSLCLCFVPRESKALCFGSIISESETREKSRSRRAAAHCPSALCVCVCGSDDGGGGVRDCILSLVVVEKKHITTKSNCVGLERELDRIW